ncbi:amidohydrolase family protein [Pseudorhodoplanes sinuspersici]|uniref:Metal-dependent hydrolase n=1 Tax=Pseudorhodoplanes sinuspersici TaxID=1235591 RepID=A0A1W6ZXN9_9HYPH|nr:amidohydrolase family protein [Pseudorhodoplanes sinuspersici]ARQ01525.1 metal-dependent hydrolase [Pseudorhodoplanes sinuspersici]RKE73227.1 putative TIM-barrel fold metal-dependent hydrolase [Pseudorhodoplanes sinuspersici]
MLSRRTFLNGTLGAGLLASQGAQPISAQPMQTQPAKKRTIVDAQVHLWQANSPERPWVAGMKPQLPEPFTIEKLLPLMDEAGVDRAIIVPPSWEGDRIDYALEAAQRYPSRFGVMGRLPLKTQMTADDLVRWKARPGLLGIRLTFLGATAAALTDGTADWLWPAAEKAGVPIMFLTAGTLPLFAKIAERHPNLTLIIDHMGVSSQVVTEKKIPVAIDDAVALAKHQNISVKLSAAPAYSSETYPFGDMTNYIQRLFDAYGPQRCYWGTDVTNGFAKATYRERLAHFMQELKFLSEEDRDWIMGRAIIARLKWSEDRS